MIKGKTESGFEFEIDEQVVNDMRVIDAMVAAYDENLGGVSRLISLVLTPEQKKDFYAHLADEHGRVPLERASKEIFQILQYNGETKN
jgi:hypothetical protein